MKNKQSEIIETLRAFVKDYDKGIRNEVSYKAIELCEASADHIQIERCASGIHAEYDGLRAHVRQTLQAATEKAKDRHDSQITAEEMANIGMQETEAMDRKRIAESQRRRLSCTYEWSSYWWRLCVELLLISGDISANSFSLTVAGGSLLMAIGLAIVVSLGLCQLALHMGGRLRDMRLEKRFAAVLRYSAVMLPIFTALAALRSFYVFGHGRILFSSEAVTGTVIFTIINSLVFVGMVVTAMGMPSHEDRLTKRALDDCNKRIREADNAIQECRRKRALASQQSSQRRLERIDIAGEQAHLEDMISSMCESTLAAFYHEIAFRKPKGQQHESRHFNNHKNSIQ
jgi:hypothetical protein